MFGDADSLEELHRGLLGRVFRLMPHLTGSKGDVVYHREMGKEVEGLKHHPGLTTDLLNVLYVVGQLNPVNDDGPAVVLLETIDAADEGRLAGPRRTDDDNHLLQTDIHVDIGQGLEVAKELVDVG